MPKFLVSLLALSLCASGGPLFAQAQPAPANSPQVTTAFTVLDKDGKFVRNLTQNDFTLTDDGHPAAITSFTQASSQPLTMGILIQTSAGQHASLDSERAAAGVFFDHMIGPQHRAFVIQFGGEVDLLADVSADTAKLHKALGETGSTQVHNTAADQSGNGGARLDSGGATLYDAIYLASTELMKKQQPRKILIVISDGVDRDSKMSLFSTIQAAQRANTAVYAIYVKGEEQPKGGGATFPGQRRGGIGLPGSGYPGTGSGWPGGGGGRNPNPSRPTEGSRIDGRRILAQICRETGGYLYESGKKNSFDHIFSTLAGELQSQYMIGFEPGKQSDGYHRLVITPKNDDLTVQARQGYYSGDSD